MQNNIYKSIIVFILSLSLSSLAHSSELPRHAKWEAQFESFSGKGRTIKSLAPDSPLAKAGLKPGDQILSVNGNYITDGPAWSHISASLRAGTATTVGYRRNQESYSSVVNFNPNKKEHFKGIETQYTHLLNDYGIRQRVIITRPTGIDEKLPAIFLVQWLSCSSIEALPDDDEFTTRVLKALITQTNMVMLRIEKPGVGDSEGNCGKTDFQMELNGLETAMKYLQTLPYVDQDRVIIYGNSLGSALAPYFVNKYNLNGLISDGTFYRSWFEHMLEIERRIKSMQGLSEVEINEQITQAYIPLYYGMLVQKKSYAEVIAENPLLQQYNYHGLEHMYGRHVSYYHQVQDFNFAGEWSKVKAPVRIRWGTYDWIMSETDNDMIVDALLKSGNQNVILDKYPQLDHWSAVHRSPNDSFNGEKGQWEPKISQQLVDWAIELNRTSWRK